jgi:hypothetical protein
MRHEKPPFSATAFSELCWTFSLMSDDGADPASAEGSGF